MAVQQRVQDLLEPIVATIDGIELVDVEFTGGTLRLTVDRLDGAETPSTAEAGVAERSGGVTTEALTAVNRLVSPILDQHDPIPGRYTLEVSSPGLERPLTRAGHYRRAIGELVVVKMERDIEPRRLKGTLTAVGDGDHPDLTIDVVEVDGVELDEPQQRTIASADVAKARTVFEWGPAPKPGKGPSSGGKGGKGKSGKGGKGKGGRAEPDGKRRVSSAERRGVQ